MSAHPRVRLALAAIVVTAAVSGLSADDSRFLAKEDIVLYGIGLTVAPAQQTVPKDIATIVSTFLQAPNQPGVQLPPFAPNAVVMATLSGPSLPAPVDLTIQPNSPFNIPPLSVAGIHTLDNIRLVSNGDVLLRGVPESVTINVIDKLLITQVIARPLTAAEIRAKGIVFDKSNFQAFNFTAAFAVQDTTINIDFPVVLPILKGAAPVTPNQVDIPSITQPALPSLKTIIPDTLKIQSRVPNLSVVGFTLKVQGPQGQDFFVPPIPGVIVIPGDIGFLNQFFSVMLMVSNAAPNGSNLVVSNLSASIILPPGNDGVVGSADDPLAMANTAKGPSPRTVLVTQPGPDGILGTADDVATLGPGETGKAEFLVEGRREGSWPVEMELTGTLNGLPIGPVPIHGRAAGAVLVRNPTFTLTFIHPDVVSAGEPYSLDINVTNTSQSPANFVSVNLFAANISGAVLAGDSTKSVEFIAPGDSSTVSFDLVSEVTGKVTAATLDSDTHVAGRFELKSAVGELGVPLSPDTLVLPKEANSLPASLRTAALGMLGKAYAVATAPPAALPKGVQPFSRQIVWDRAVDVADAGLRLTLHEPLRDSATQLEMDFAGSKFGRLPALNPNPDDLQFATDNYTGFDGLRRASTRGDKLAQAVADLLAPDFAKLGAAAFHSDLAQKIAYRPDHISVTIGTAGGPLPFALTLIDSQNRQLGGADQNGKVVKQIPFGDYLTFEDSLSQPIGEMALLVAPGQGDYQVRLTPVPGAPSDTPFTLSLVVPRGDGTLRQLVFPDLTAQSAPATPFTPNDPYRISVVLGSGSGTAIPPVSDTPIITPPPAILGVVQQAQADVLACDPGALSGPQVGRIVAVLFNEEVTPDSVQDKFKTENITSYIAEANKVVSVALQPDGRIVFIGLRDSLGPFIPRTLTITGVTGVRGQVMTSATVPMESTIRDDGGVVTGRVIQADGTPVPFANVRLFNLLDCGEPVWVGISSKSADAQGRYSWDFVLRTLPDRIIAVDPESSDSRDIRFNVQRNGQRLNVDVVMLGRGTYKGRTLDESGKPLKATSIRVTSLTDQSQYGALTDDAGAFTLAHIPVGNVMVEAVNPTANAKTFISDNIPFAGATTTRDIVLLSVATTQITIKHGNITGHVLRANGITPVVGVPVIAYYRSGSQTGVNCPGDPPPDECAVALVNTGANGAFAFPSIVAGQLRIQTFDQASFQQGEVRTQLLPDGTVDLNVLLGAGLGTVTGIVLDAVGKPVSGARVGGGLSLTTTGADGTFTLTDVPVGQANIVAVSDALGTEGSAHVDIVRDGEHVNVTIVLTAIGGVGGVVRLSDGTTPVPNVKVYLFQSVESGIAVVGTATTDDQGRYSMTKIAVGDYTASAFRPDFSDGNVAKVAIKFMNQVVKSDITFRGGGGKVAGTVFDSDGVTPLKAKVSVSGDQVVIAGGQVGVGFVGVQNFQIADTDFTTGAFTLSGVWVGPFTLRAAGQFSPDPIALAGTMPSAGATVQMNVKLLPTSTVSGRVLLPDGVTPAGANVVVTYKSDEFKIICAGDNCTTIPQGIQQEVVTTDANGRFGLPLVNAGTFTLTVQDPVSGKIGITHGSVKAGENVDLSVRLLGVGQITVQVIGGDATTPIPGAKVVINQLDYPKKSFTAFANSQGTLLVGGGDSFGEGAFVVSATDVRNGFAGRASGKIVQDGDQVTVKVFLFNQAGVVSGSVFKSDGLTSVPNAEVTIAGPSGPFALTLTDASGNYQVDQIPLLVPLTVEVFEASTARRGFATGMVEFDKQQVPINVTEAALGVVRGTVLESGTLAPLKGWEVSLDQISSGGLSLPSLRTTASVDGSFSFPGVSQGTVNLSAHLDGVVGSGAASTSIATEGQVVDVPLIVKIVRPLVGAMEGIVYNPDGSAAANSQVDVCSDCGHPPVTVTAGPDGGFSISQLPLGRYQVRARSQTTGNVGLSYVQLTNDGETVGVTVTMVGLTQINGQVVKNDGSIGANVKVVLEGLPSPGCSAPSPGQPASCTNFADGAGNFSFVDVPARLFTATAVDPISGLKGVVGGTLNPGETKVVRIVLQPTGSVHGRVLFQNGSPASGVVAHLLINGADLFTESAGDGTFAFPTTALGSFELDFQDPVGTGIAKRFGTILGDVDLGDVRLVETPPAVGSVTPAASSIGVPLAQAVTIVFTEKIDASTITQASVTLSDGTSLVPATLALTNNDTTVTLTPLSPLKQATRYSIRVTAVKDLVGKVMAADYVATFTSVDLTPATYVELSPAQNTSGVTILSTVRVQLSKPIDPTKFTGVAIAVTGPSAPVDGRIDYTIGNTVIVFTPARPLALGTTYTVHVAAATDLSGNVQPQSLDYTFATTSLTPPAPPTLSAPASVIENTVATVQANVGTASDVASVDFFINGVLRATSHPGPFSLSFQAGPSFGKVGDQVTVSAVSTDTSGLRSAQSAPVALTITPDQPPVVTITSPADGQTFKNGDRVVVVVKGTDDVGVVQEGYKAQTGKPQDTALKTIAPPGLADTESFAFNVPLDAGPGAAIRIEASASDTKGQISQATPISIVVLDSVPPTVAITGASTGDKVKPGQQTTVVVSAQDLGGVKTINFSTAGIVVVTDSRGLSPAQTSALASFSFQVPASARPGDSITLQASAFDQAGNLGTAPSVILPVADTVPPTVSLRTASGSTNIVAGQTVSVLADATDDISVAQVQLTGTGAFSTSDAKQVSPPTGNAEVAFSIQVPANLTPGAVLNLQATAADTSNNVSSPAFLSLTVQSLVDVTLPPSVIVNAGQSVDVTVQITGGAPAGQVVTFKTVDSSVATVTPAVTFGAGETSKTVSVTGVAGGTVKLSALIGIVERASMTVTVQGGLVDGEVVQPGGQGQQIPVAGASVTVADVTTALAAVTDSNGHFSVAGLVGPQFTVTALDPVTHLHGAAEGQLQAANGFASVTVVLMSAGSVHGTVVLPAAGQTPAGAGIKVEIFASNDLSTAIGTTFTKQDGTFQFPLVTLGSYVIDATATDGRRGRSNAIVAASGQDVPVVVTFLGEAIVTGTVFNGGGQPVPNAALTFRNPTIFGGGSTITSNARQDGTFEVDHVQVGSFQITATDPVTNQAAVASGTVTSDGQIIKQDLHLAAYGVLVGTVFRADGTTTVPNATVSVNNIYQTTTDSLGKYSFPVLPLSQVTVTVFDPATRGLGLNTGSLSVQGQAVTVDIQLLGQGSVVGTVTDANGNPQAGATLSVLSKNGSLSDGLSAITHQDGTVVIDHVLAGTLTISAVFGSLQGQSPSLVLAAGDVAHVTVKLQPTGSIAGIVFGPDGQTPVNTGTVALLGPIGPLQTPVAADGSFRFDGLTLSTEFPMGSGKFFSTYQLTAYDTPGRLRALVSSIAVTANGQVVTQNLTFVGLGNVKGRVVNPDGSSAPSELVQVHALNPQFGGFASATTDAAGFYEVDNLAAGAVAVTTADAARGLLGEAFGQILHDGDTATVDVLFQSNAINLPVTLYDGSTFPFDLQNDGSTHSGRSAFSGYDAQGAGLLDFVSGGVTTHFTGSSIGTLQSAGREVTIRQQGVAGLNVTRKIFVPKDGYFARYIEILSNPTASPITVDVRVTSHIQNFYGAAIAGIISTSSGDAVLDVTAPTNPDRWVTIGGQDGDPFQGGANAPPLAFTFGSDGAAQAVSAATFTDTLACFYANYCDTGHLVYQWSSVTVQPGATVAYMHFVTQETSYAGANAAAARLEQLPPEAMVGLSADEVPEIKNFAVPQSGTSLVPPLRPLVGTVTGQVLDGDGLTPVPGYVSFKSANVLFGRTYQVTADQSGHFTFASNLSGSFNQILVPEDSYSLIVRHPQTSLKSPTVTGAFIAGQDTSATNVVFTNAGLLVGHVRRANGQIAPPGSVSLSGTVNAYTQIGADGAFHFGGLPAGPVTLTANVSHPQGSSLTATATATITAGTTATTDVILPPTGLVSGTVLTGAGGPAVSQQVQLFGGLVNRSTYTDSSGKYTLSDVPVATYTARVVDPTTHVVTDVPVTVTQDQTAVVNLSLVATGTLHVQVNFASGAPAPGASIQVQRSDSWYYYGTADQAGGFTVQNFPVGMGFIVRAFHPLKTQLSATVTGVPLSTSGQVATVTLSLPAIATVRMIVTKADGTPLSGGQIDFTDALNNFSTGTTDQNGVAAFQNVPEGAFSFFAFDASFHLVGRGSGSVAHTDDGRTIDVPIAAGVPLPATLVDGNHFSFDVEPNGSQNNVVQMPHGNGFGNFQGAQFATSQLGGQQLATSQTGVCVGGGCSLDITRKIYVPSDGYFARHLEVLKNSGTAPITVDVELVSDLFSTTSFFGPTLVATSSGGTTLTAKDVWFVTDDDNGSSPFPASDPTMAFVLGGPGSAVPLGSPSLTRFYDYGRGRYANEAVWSWNSLTIQPGQTVILMHFAVQQFNQPGAIASAQRLAQLPPEAIAGLSADERTQIVNWKVAADGSSAVAALPVRNGVLTGKVLGGDGLTPVKSAPVTLKSPNNAIFSTVLANADANGQLALSNLPVEVFTLTATDPRTMISSPVVQGSFAAGQTAAVQDIVFTNSGVLTGTVLRNGAGVANAQVQTTLNGQTVTVTADASGAYAITGLPPGSYLVTATSGAVSGSVTATIVSGQGTALNVPIGLGTITGLVTFANGSPAAGASVGLLRTPQDRGAFMFTTTDGTGKYTFNNIPIGFAFIVQATHPADQFDRQTVSGLVPGDGQTITVNETLQASGSAHITVVDVDGVTPLASRHVYVDRHDGAGAQFVGQTDTNGMTTVQNVEAPAFTVSASDNFGPIGSTDGSVPTEGAIVSVKIQAAATGGTVQGTIFAADGVTPPNFGESETGIPIELIDKASGTVLQSIQSFSAHYSISARVTGAQGFIVRAHSPFDNTVVAEGSGSFTKTGQIVTIDLTLPIAVVSGTVTFADGSPVSHPNVHVMISATTGNRTFYSSRSDPSGAYGVVVTATGDFALTAQDPSSGLTQTVNGTVADLVSPIHLDVQLPASATLGGTVTDNNGQPVQSVYVYLVSVGSTFSRNAQTDAQGHYQFDHVPLSPFDVQSCIYNGTYSCGSLRGTMGAGGATANLTIKLNGTVAGQVFQADGMTLVANPVVTVTSPDNTGPFLSNPQVFGNGTASGSYTASKVMPGTLNVWAFGSNAAGTIGGVASGSLTPGGNSTVNVTLGNAATLNFNLDGPTSNGFRYDVQCRGNLLHGGHSGNNPAFNGASYIELFNGSTTDGGSTSLACLQSAGLEAGQRQLVLSGGHIDALGLDVTRKIFVPASGSFGRYLEELSNPNTTDLTVRVRVTGYLAASPANVQLAVDPDTNGHTVGVFTDAAATASSAGFVMGGPNAAVKATTTFVSGQDFYLYEWIVTVPAGQTRTLMHFLVQGPPGDASSPTTESNALDTLSDPDALTGMSASEKASVVNFVINP